MKICSSELSEKFSRHFWKTNGRNILRTADLTKWALQLRVRAWDIRLRTEIFSQEYTNLIKQQYYRAFYLPKVAQNLTKLLLKKSCQKATE